MADPIRKCTTHGLEWEDNSVYKPTGDEVQHNHDNYETAASQRPRRVPKRTVPFCAAQKSPPKKPKREPRKPPTRPKKAQAPNKSRAKPRAIRGEEKILVEGQSPTASASTIDVLPATQTREKKSLKLTLKFNLTTTSGGPATQNPAQAQDSHESGNSQSVQRNVLRSRNPTSNKLLQDQCAQRLQAPVPANSQDIVESGTYNTEQVISQETILQLPRTPRRSPRKKIGYRCPAQFEPPKSTSSQTIEDSLAPPTPDSVPYCSSVDVLSSSDTHLNSSQSIEDGFTLPLLLPKHDPPQVLTAQSTDTSDLSDVDSQATTEYEDAIEHLSKTSINNEQLNSIVAQLFAHRKSDSPKPEPIGQLELWADGRQELCETLHYFRAYQSACYSTGGFVRAFMFDNIAHARDYIDSNVVISRAGGGLAKDKVSGDMKAGRDQVEDTAAKGLRNCMSHFNPVVIITGAENPHIPSKPPRQYCVLDYFKPTHIWAEKSGGKHIIRYRFEKLSAKKSSWWHPKDTSDPVELGSLPPPVYKNCDVCREQSPQVYLNGWMCLQPTCTAFWKVAATYSNRNVEAVPYEPNEATLVYDPRFLKQRTPWHNDDHEYPLISNAAELSGYSIPGEDTSQAYWLGMVCPDCGRCNSRLDWMGWTCQNPTCNFKKEPPHTLIPAFSVREPLWPLTDSYTLSRDTQSSLIDVKVTFAHGYRINRYTIPGISGFITHMIANRAVVAELGGPDAMFEELQQTDIGLKRRPMPNGQLKGPNYCRHFAVNYGMPYKFIAATASHSFSTAARPITATRSRLNWAARLLLSQEIEKSMEEVTKEWKDKEFNEVLALGYFEAQKINYHDDGEHGLGPTIATLSLGAPGTMRIRMKARHHHGVSSAGVYDDVPPLPGCQSYAARVALQPALEALKLADPKAYNARRKQIPKELGPKTAGNARDCLTLQLGHGDVVVMHGAELQRYYEHAVEHRGKLRFALTCRHIDLESLKEGERPGYVVGRDAEGYEGSRIVM